MNLINKTMNNRKRKHLIMKAVANFFSSFTDYNISRDKLLSLIHEDFNHDTNKEIFNDLFEYAKNTKITEFEFLNFAKRGTIGNEPVYKAFINMKYEINTKLAHKFNVSATKEFAFFELIDFEVNLHYNNKGEIIVNPFVLKLPYMYALNTVAVPNNEPINENTEITDNTLITVFKDKKIIGYMRKSNNKWGVKIGDTIIGSYATRKECILANKEYQFKISVGGKFKTVVL